jgi:hypothetical protein
METRRSFLAGSAFLAAARPARTRIYGTSCSACCGSLNVKDPAFAGGAKGDGITNDTAAIQACFDTAFGPASAPHGVANSTQNASVYFPPGLYRVGQLTLTQVFGGHIFGEGTHASMLAWNGGFPRAPRSLLVANGLQDSRIEDIGFDLQSTRSNPNLTGINLIGNGPVSASGNVFSNLGFLNLVGGTCFNLGAGASSNLLASIEISNVGVGIKTTDPTAVNNNIIDGTFASPGAPLIWVAAGSISSVIGGQWAGNGSTDIGMRIDAGDTTIVGSRSEIFNNWVTINGGSLTMVACVCSAGGTSGKGFISMSGNQTRVLLDNVNNAGQANGVIVGTGTLEIRASTFTAPGQTNPAFAIAGFTGTLTRWRMPNTILANLPAPSASKVGMEVVVTDSGNPATAASFGQAVIGGGTNPALVRWNGSAWTVMGV